MSATVKPIRIPDFVKKKAAGEKIAMLTAYDATVARLLDRAGIDAILVGDSLGMVVLGYSTTIPVTLQAMIHHTRAVCNGVKRALIVADMPFLTYQTGVADAVRNAGRLIQEGGAAAVKLEGGRAIAEVVARLSEVGIPVMGHVGLTPQSVHKFGGFRRVGKTTEEADEILQDALALEKAGAFAVVLESIPPQVAASITAQLQIPTIGIGAGPDCDGQILVSYDALGLFDQFVPSFVKCYANVGEVILEAAAAYISDVRAGRFPESGKAAPVVIRSIAEIRRAVREARRRGCTIGFVPTMGALHEGHGALIRRAREECGYVVVSVFVNPIQFDRADDFARYPRNLEADVDFAGKLRVDAVFAPSVEEMYPDQRLTSVRVASVSEGLCGAYRPGHFEGVATVVTKLFHIVEPDRAYLGEKDAQQLAVIQKMVADLNIPLTIVPVPTLREPDGLALSSRNQRLSHEDRAAAPVVYRALKAAAAAVAAGAADPLQVKQVALEELAQEPRARLEYLEIVEPESMQPVSRIEGPVRIAAAVWFGDVRLIDNLLCAPGSLPSSSGTTRA